MVFILTDIAKAYFTVGRAEDAWTTLRECDDLLRKQGNLPMLVDSLITSAGGHYFLGGFTDAQTSAEECGEVSRSIGNTRVQAVSQYVLVAVYMELGEIGKAIAALGESVPLSARLRLSIYRGMIGDTEGGLTMANAALADGHTRQFALAAMAQAHLSSGDNAKAQELITEACKEFEDGDSDPRAGYSIFQVIEGDVALANGCYSDALELAERTLGVLNETGQQVAYRTCSVAKGRR